MRTVRGTECSACGAVPTSVDPEAADADGGMRGVLARTVKERLEAARQKDYVTVKECALLFGISERTVWRRLPQLGQAVRDGHLVRINRRAAARFFLKIQSMPAGAVQSGP